jgi:branched-chain amino acid transport system substrate-binding protein
VDPPASQLIDPKRLRPGVAELTQEMLKRYKTFEPNIPTGEVAPHVSMGFNNMWILLNDVLPRAIQKHGGFGSDALAKAARETDIPEGGTMQGYGVKFQPAGHPMAGQNMRAIAAVFQVVDGNFKHVYPPVVASMAQPPVLLPSSSPYLAR